MAFMYQIVACELRTSQAATELMFGICRIHIQVINKYQFSLSLIRHTHTKKHILLTHVLFGPLSRSILLSHWKLVVAKATNFPVHG